MFSKSVCSAVCYNTPNNFQPTAKRQVFLSCSKKQRQRREEAPGCVWDGISVNAAQLRALRRCRRKPGILEEEERAREMTATSLLGPTWDSSHGKPAADLRADNTVVGGMPSCLSGRRVSSPSTIDSFCDLPKLCQYGPRHH